ncbi:MULTISPECIES: hypothetical protein [Bacillus]|uniref:hypothetical protein n=1 Tax=Bacillus TaxID=1386 RepID=UPI002244E703|nr:MULTISPECIES: hypothetical protein [Bacillus]MDN5388053.1 hypothetical protein [Bacillus sp. LB7]MEC1021269.1 hypothetical protein [Bacillus paralicheniformis]MEC1026600.1 hypothetical protein [Bacillus paralicheniformis]MEC1034895.1 hypothetical protein [Bacillus paralicheniformis]MEC1049903.1 hypothetical protein [Bacillus paralicheniformis]
MQNVLTYISLPLAIIHMGILYVWLFHWELLATKTGCFIWSCSIIMGFILFTGRKSAMITTRLIFASTLMVIILVIFTLAIDAVTSSMP